MPKAASSEHGTASCYWRGCRNPECVEAYRAYHRKSQGKRKERITQVKLDRGCADCGYKDHPAALDFDHVTGEKLFEIGPAATRSWESIEAEIEKCEVVCANCHRIRTYNRRERRE